MEQESTSELAMVTTTLQAQERFHRYIVKEKQKTAQEFLDKSRETLENLREMKSQLEGTSVTYSVPCVSDTVLSTLRSQVLMHVPKSLTADVKQNLAKIITTSLSCECRKVVFIAMTSCPWYYSSQSERGQQARHNGILVVYVNHDEQFFSPVNAHHKEQAEVIDKGWFYAVELFHFTSHLVRGKSRFVETLFLPDCSIILQTEEWDALAEATDTSKFLKLRGFLEQCRGQAVGAVGKKSKSSGIFKLKDASTLYEFCESFRLLQHAHLALQNKSLLLDESLDVDALPPVGQKACHILHSVYQEDGTVNKQDLFDCVMEWKGLIDKQMSVKGQKYTPVTEVEQEVGSWMARLRLQGANIHNTLSIAPSEREKLEGLLQKVGGVVTEMPPENIVMIAQAGSFLYDLHMPSSDIDYLVIYAEPTEKLASLCRQPLENVENRGPQKLIEYGAYEVRLLCEMLLKGSVVVTEVLFVDNIEYASEAWKELVRNQMMFVTEHLILQYFGLIKNNMHTILNGKHKNSPRERKLFYQIFHKLAGVESMLDKQPPCVRCTGHLKEFIMQIRKGNDKGEFSRDNLIQKARDKINYLRIGLNKRQHRLPEHVNYDWLTQWLLSLRGLKS